MIDWDLAVSTGVRFARPGPQVSLAEARQTVAELRELSMAVERPVREVTKLQSKVAPGKVAVVDRAGWIRGNVDGFRVVLDPLAEQLRQRTPAASAGNLAMGIGSRVSGVQAGMILSYLSSRVLGQYELFLPPGTDENGAEPVGRLTLVAPNIVMVERELQVNPRDFRRWVCLHEETHRVQFTSVPWLRAYVQDQMSEFLLASDLDPGAILSRLRAAADAAVNAVRGGDGESLIEAVQTPRQKEILARLTALMTLVEGHGDYVMDAVGPQVVPSVAEIREKFNTRRRTAGRVEQAIRRLLGIDLKMKQYADGSRFVKAVVDEIGMDGFNQIWESPETIPTMAEISDPHAWITRVASAYVKPAALTAPPVEAPAPIASPEGPVTAPEDPASPGPSTPASPASSTPATPASSNGSTADGAPRAEDISLEEYLPPSASTPDPSPAPGTPAGPAPTPDPDPAPAPPPGPAPSPSTASEPSPASVFTPRPWKPGDEPPSTPDNPSTPDSAPDSAPDGPPSATAEPSTVWSETPAASEPDPATPPADETGSADPDDQPHS
ncbi:MAG: zinc-dependent metalloprotease [Actinobacteria bacterium]|nr:zinc-dependent metalloprotease [Actinomycetota bacterium]